MLVYYEVYEDIQNAIAREKQIKGGSRKKKLELIEWTNPLWRDMSNNWTASSPRSPHDISGLLRSTSQ